MARLFGQALKFGSLGLMWIVNGTLQPDSEREETMSDD